MAGLPSGRGIPWQRVVGAGGKIRMPEPHASKQRRLLESEGVEVGMPSIDMKVYGWLPKRKKSRKSKTKPKSFK
jgi:methylated-DNA-protein-cysteine methyltransferase-like protein